MYICIFWGEVKANVCWQEPALTGGWGCYLQALADTPFSGQRLIPDTEAFIGLQGICSRDSIRPELPRSFWVGV